MAETVDWPPRRPPRRRGRLVVVLLLGAIALSAGTTLSYYVEALWFSSLGYGDVFWTTLNLQSRVFLGTALITFAALYGTFRALKPDNLGLTTGRHIVINGQPLILPVEPVLRLIALGAAIFIARGDGLRHDVRMADARALLVRARRRRLDGRRSGVRPADRVLPLLAAGARYPLRLADDARRRRLRDCDLLRGRRRRHARAGSRTPAGGTRR